MKVLAELAKKVGHALSLDLERAAPGVIIMRKLLLRNAKKWHDWAVKWGVPNPIPPEEMHVTVMFSSVEVKVPLIETPISIEVAGISPFMGAGGVFAMFGPEENVLVFAFRCWELHDRHWMMLDHGCETSWPSYRPHLSLSYDAAGFELPEEALLDVPRFVIMDGETAAKPNPPAALVAKSAATDSLVPVSDELKAAASEALKALKAEGSTANLIDVYDLADIAKGRMLASTQKRLGDAEWAPAELKAPTKPAATETRKRAQKEFTVSVSSIPEEIAKNFAARDVFKANEDEQIVMGIASVSTEKGELITDSHGDQITTKALVEFNRSLIAGGREGKIMHEGEACTEVVAGLVLTEEWQKSLGIDLGYEPYLVEIHVPDPGQWAEIKKGDGWMLSIAGLMWYYEDEADA
jgi:hypothetical protein